MLMAAEAEVSAGPSRPAAMCSMHPQGMDGGVKSPSVSQLGPSHPMNAGRAALCFIQSKVMPPYTWASQRKQCFIIPARENAGNEASLGCCPCSAFFHTCTCIASPPRGHPPAAHCLPPSPEPVHTDGSGRSLQQSYSPVPFVPETVSIPIRCSFFFILLFCRTSAPCEQRGGACMSPCAMACCGHTTLIAIT